VLVGALYVGWILGTIGHAPVIVHAAVLGMISGGIIVNVIKGELPGREEGPLAPWVAGALSYTGLLVALIYAEHT
jgi:hypothetical protein